MYTGVGVHWCCWRRRQCTETFTCTEYDRGKFRLRERERGGREDENQRRSRCGEKNGAWNSVERGPMKTDGHPCSHQVTQK